MKVPLWAYPGAFAAGYAVTLLGRLGGLPSEDATAAATSTSADTAAAASDDLWSGYGSAGGQFPDAYADTQPPVNYGGDVPLPEPAPEPTPTPTPAPASAPAPAVKQYTAFFAAGALVRIYTLNSSGRIVSWRDQTWGPKASSAACDAPVHRTTVDGKSGATTVRMRSGYFAGKHIRVGSGVTVKVH